MAEFINFDVYYEFKIDFSSTRIWFITFDKYINNYIIILKYWY